LGDGIIVVVCVSPFKLEPVDQSETLCENSIGG